MSLEPGGLIEMPVEELRLPSEEIRRRLQEKAELLAELQKNRPAPPMKTQPVSEQTQGEDPAPTKLSSRITADGRKLAGLATRARKLEAIAESAAEKANAARELAGYARSELDQYMREHGLV